MPSIKDGACVKGVDKTCRWGVEGQHKCHFLKAPLHRMLPQ